MNALAVVGGFAYDALAARVGLSETVAISLRNGESVNSRTAQADTGHWVLLACEEPPYLGEDYGVVYVGALAERLKQFHVQDVIVLFHGSTLLADRLDSAIADRRFPRIERALSEALSSGGACCVRGFHHGTQLARLIGRISNCTVNDNLDCFLEQVREWLRGRKDVVYVVEDDDVPLLEPGEAVYILGSLRHRIKDLFMPLDIRLQQFQSADESTSLRCAQRLLRHYSGRDPNALLRVWADFQFFVLGASPTVSAENGGHGIGVRSVLPLAALPEHFDFSGRARRWCVRNVVEALGWGASDLAALRLLCGCCEDQWEVSPRSLGLNFLGALNAMVVRRSTEEVLRVLRAEQQGSAGCVEFRSWFAHLNKTLMTVMGQRQIFGGGVADWP